MISFKKNQSTMKNNITNLTDEMIKSIKQQTQS